MDSFGARADLLISNHGVILDPLAEVNAGRQRSTQINDVTATVWNLRLTHSFPLYESSYFYDWLSQGFVET